MANKRVSSKEDPLVPTMIYLKKSQIDFLNNLGDNKSAIIRKLVDAQMSGHEIEINKLKDEARRHEAKLNIINAQISELEAVDQRKQAASKTREQIIDQAAERLLKGNQEIDFRDREFLKVFNNNIQIINRDVGENSEPVTAEELKKIIITKANEKEIEIYEIVNRKR